jgi:hypothetical protein
MRNGELKYNNIDTFFIEGKYIDTQDEYFSTNEDPFDGYNEAIDNNIENIQVHIRYNNGIELRIK